MARECGIPARTLEIGPPPVSKQAIVRFFWHKNAMRDALIRAIDALDTPPTAVCMLSLSEKILLTQPLVERGIRVVWIEHDPVGRWLTGNPWLRTLLRASRSATTVTVSELSRAMYVEMGWDAQKTVAIPNGVATAEAMLRPAHEGLVVGCVARLAREKGVDILMDAVEEMDDTEAHIVGTGPEDERLRARGGKHSIQSPRMPDIDALYAHIDALALPSRTHDPFGLVAAEAMMRGIPTVVTDACGIAGYLRDGEDALIVPAGDAEALRAALETLRDSALRTRLGAEGRKTAQREFSAETMTERYERLLEVSP
jgi:glycosyltransferase involved in cell wall biosynthesis